ncbi:putative intracellular septation protein [Escherichia coli]|uniref:Putative intracellular septation protein n=1 Tax=Escherichia coli TaxID=562 RepID=A0A377D5V2_ECOLX|nr:putative intracellular septation protein [Escherichia coli]
MEVTVIYALFAGALLVSQWVMKKAANSADAG